MSRKIILIKQELLLLVYELNRSDCWRKMRKFDLSLRSSRSSYFATFRHQLTILSKTDALDEEKWLNMLGTFVKDWFRYESHFVHGRDSLVDILKERGRSEERFSRNAETDIVCRLLLEKKNGFASHSDSRYLARMDAPVSATDPPSGKISQRSASRSVSGTSILSHTVSFGNPAISVASAKGSLWYTTPPPKRFNAARCEVSELSSSSDSAVPG